jgi:serine/threonine-protein kinase RsbW
MAHEAFRTFAAEPGSPRRARCWVRAECAAWCDDEKRERLVLVVSELVTNALVHGSGRIGLRLDCAPGRIRVEVADGGTASIEPRSPAGPIGERGLSIGGRGLHVVEALSERWGVSRAPGSGNAVWAEIRTERQPSRN